MSNYYISNCCGAIPRTEEICSTCLCPCEVTAMLDEPGGVPRKEPMQKNNNLGTIYYLHPKISWKQFKWIQTEAYKGTGHHIVMVNFDKITWRMLRERKINIGFNPKNKTDPIFFTVRNIPKLAKLIR